MNYRNRTRDPTCALGDRLAPTGLPTGLSSDLGAPKSLDKPSRVTFLAQSRSTQAPRGLQEANLVAPGGASTLQNRAPVQARTQILRNCAWALENALEPLWDPLWDPQGRSWSPLGPP